MQVVPSVFVPDIELAIQDFVAKWQDRDESLNFAQRYVSYSSLWECLGWKLFYRTSSRDVFETCITPLAI